MQVKWQCLKEIIVTITLRAFGVKKIGQKCKEKAANVERRIVWYYY